MINPICTVLLITFNHRPYIRQAIESVLSQKTKRPFIIKIFDDASTDGSSDIVREYAKKYPDLIEAHIAKKNQGAQNNIWKAYNSVNTKYCILLETDDCWCDNKKLQLQINALEAHPECSFCAHQSKIHNIGDDFRKNEEGFSLIADEYILKHNIISLDYVINTIIGSGYIPSLTSRLVRTSALKLKNVKYKEAVLFDNCQFWYLLLQGKMYFINRTMSIYNQTGTGTGSGKSPLIRASDYLLALMELNKQTNYVLAKRILQEIILYIEYSLRITEQNGISTLSKQTLPLKKKHQSFLYKLKHHLIPPIILDIFNIPRNIGRIIRREGNVKQFKKIIKYFIPPILHEFVTFLRDTSRFIRHVYLKDPRIRFCLKKRAPWGGWYPCHIKGYHTTQMKAVEEQLGDNPENLVIFFNVMCDFISGGVLSIDRFVQYSKKFIDPNTRIIESGIPLSNAVVKNPYFDFAQEPIAFNYIIKHSQPKKVLLNIPECFVPSFIEELNGEHLSWLRSIPDLRINILNQSDEVMPQQFYIEELRSLCDNKLTITAAHVRYCTKEKEKQYRCPVYLLTPFLPDFYRVEKENKEKVIVLSPDQHLYRERVISLLKRELPDYKLQVVEKMKLEDYKKLIAKSLFAITFGEGYDGYFIEPYLSNSISFTIRNPKFFPENFNSVPTVYDNWDMLEKNIVKDIKLYYEDTKLYKKTATLVENEIKRFTNNKQAEKDLNDFYKRFSDKY